MSESSRQLAAIMFTDMVGYTALMQQNEQQGIIKRNRHREVLEKQHRKYQGKIIQYFGDGTLSLFPNSSDAVACAVEIQKALNQPPEVPLRIGIHSGDVIVASDGVLGDAVNIASRIESFANIGGVLISDTLFDQVKNQSQWDFLPMGNFKLKNVERPFDIYAVDVEGIKVPNPDFLKGKGDRTAVLKTQIPEPSGPILGRSKEVGDLIELLYANRVVTITGTGGMGKTRLSLEICQRLKDDFQDGMAFVSMATLSEAKEVMPTLSANLDIKEAGGRSMVKGVAALLGDRKAFIVLDNLEHVIEAAQEIAELVSLCPNLKILCTSRTPLKIKAEQEYPLHPLPLPENDHQLIEHLQNYPAIDLFVRKATKVNLDFELTKENLSAVVQICQRMDGLPLALELAAARVRVLSPEKLLDRLGRALDVLTTGSKDLPERHQTLRATIDWSHSLLDDAEKQLFRRLAIFAGGFTLEALESICYQTQDDAFLAIDQLESLIDKGLVEIGNDSNRFTMLQTIRDFAMEKLNQSEELQIIHEKHTNFYFDLAKTIQEGTQGQQQLLRLKMGNLEEANMQVSLDYLLSKAKEGDEEAKETGLSFCGELWMYWHIRGKHVTAKNLINSFFESTPDQSPSLGKCQALMTTVVCHWMLGEFEKCKKLALLQYSTAEQIQDELELAKASLNVLFGYMFLDLEIAKKYAKETLSRFEKLGRKYWLGVALWVNGVISVMDHDLITARKRYQQVKELNDEIGDYELQGGALSGLAMLENIDGEYQRSIELYQEALSAYEKIGDRAEEARVLYEALWVYLDLGDINTALKYTLESIQAYQEVGSTRGIGISMIGLAAIEVLKNNPIKAIEISAAAEYLAEQEGIVNFYGANNQGISYLDKAKETLSLEEITEAQRYGRSTTLKDILQDTPNWTVLIE